MPLQIPNMKEGSTTILNTWASDQENTLASHANQIAQLQTTMNNLLKKNPTLVNPNAKK